MEPEQIDGEENSFQVLNIIFKNGCNIIAELVFMDEHSYIINRPVEIKKRPQYGNEGIFEAITTSPWLLMVQSHQCTIPASDVLTRNWLHDGIYSLYGKLADKYYMDISELATNDVSITPTGTIH